MKKRKEKRKNRYGTKAERKLPDMQGAKDDVRILLQEDKNASIPNTIGETKVEINQIKKMVNISIIKVTKKPFRSSEGEMIDYYWYKGRRTKDEAVIEFGSTVGHELGETLDLNIEKVEKPDGTFRYKETGISKE